MPAPARAACMALCVASLTFPMILPTSACISVGEKYALMRGSADVSSCAHVSSGAVSAEADDDRVGLL
jgi:hypothetical protein